MHEKQKLHHTQHSCIYAGDIISVIFDGNLPTEIEYNKHYVKAYLIWRSACPLTTRTSNKVHVPIIKK